MMDPIYAAARHYHELGFPVLPVTKNKRPYERWTAYQERWKAEGQTAVDVEHLFREPRWGIGLLLSPYSPLTVLDCDGPHALDLWRETEIILPATATNFSPSGGPHLYLIRPANCNGLKRTVRIVQEHTPCGAKPGGCGVDLLCNGFAICPPTPGYREDPDHPFGTFAELPPAVLALMRHVEQQHTAQGDGALQGTARNVRLTSVAGSLRRGGIEEAEIRTAIAAINTHRYKPPLPADEISRIAKSVSRYTPTDEAPRSEGTEPVDLTTGVEVFLRTDPPPLLMDIESVRLSGDSGWTSGLPKSMKGLFSLEEARANATGTPFLGYFPARQNPVLYVSEEDRVPRLHRRVRAMMEGRPPEEIPGDKDLRFLVKGGVKLDTKEGVEVLRRHIEIYRPALVFLEHFDKMHTKDGDRAPEVKPILHALDELTDRFGCTFRIQKHAKKTPQGQKPRTGELIAGSVSLFGWGDSSVHLTLIKRGLAMVESEAKDGELAGRFFVQYADGRLVHAGSVKEGVKEQRQGEILDLITGTPGVTVAEIATRIDLSTRSVWNYVKALQVAEVVVGNQVTSKHPTRLWVKGTEPRENLL